MTEEKKKTGKWIWWAVIGYILLITIVPILLGDNGSVVGTLYLYTTNAVILIVILVALYRWIFKKKTK